MVERPVYLDNHATTRTDPRVVEAMLPYFTTHYGNPASLSHPFGWAADEAVERARAQVARGIGAEPREIVFTAGATEANNLALRGALPDLRRRGDHLVAAATEHRAVLDPLRRLAREGWRVTLVPPDRHGLVAAEAVAAALTDRTVLVAVMAASNEVGTINPVAEIARLCHERGVLFHTDATQAVGKIPLDVADGPIDLLSVSAHKLHGPKGIGALYVRRSDPAIRIAPQMEGGGQERGLRSGTPAVPLIVGFGRAVEIAAEERNEEAARVRGLRDRLHALLAASLDGLHLNGHPADRLPGNLHLSFDGVEGEALILGLRDVAVSSGAACSTADRSPSHVLRALGVDEDRARASLRFGVGRFNTPEEIEFAAATVAAVVRRLRGRGG